MTSNTQEAAERKEVAYDLCPKCENDAFSIRNIGLHYVLECTKCSFTTGQTATASK